MQAFLSGPILWPLFLLIVSALLCALINELNNRFFRVQRLKVLLIMAGAVVAGGVLLSVFATSLQAGLGRMEGRWTFAWTKDPGPPVIIGIYPVEEFGDLHRSGLQAAQLLHAGKIGVTSLTAPLEKMRSNDADELLAELRTLVTTRNVVGVVGPPVSEFTKAVIDALKASGRRPPLFVTSATPRGPVGWDGEKYPVFRINSGGDERAEEFATLADEAVRQNVHLTFLVEEADNQQQQSYGEMVFQVIQKRLNNWERLIQEGRLSYIRYPRGRVLDVVRPREAELFGRNGIVMLLALGGDYVTLAENFYGASHPTRQALLGGWMNAYRSEQIFRGREYQWDRLFEITDVGLPFPDGVGARQLRQRIGQPLSPATRDQAFSFDAGNVLVQAYEHVAVGRSGVGSPRIDDGFHRLMLQYLRGLRIDGVTGPILFDNNGQNVGLQRSSAHGLTYTNFRPNAGWVRLDGPKHIVSLARTAPSSAKTTEVAAAR